MKRSGVRFWIALFMLFVFIAHLTDATEADPKGVATSTSKNEPATDLKLAPPVSDLKLVPPVYEKGEAGKTAKEETKQSAVKDEPNKAPIKKKDEILEEPKPQGKNEKGSANGVFDVDKCDPLNRCVDEKSTLVACLRVPGEDLLDFSLLIQNKGKESLEVNIIAPDFVSLEQNTVQLKAKENSEVKGSVKGGSANDTVIVLKAGEGSCSLTLRNMVPNSIKKSEAAALPGYLSHHLSTRSSFILLLVAASLLAGLAWSCVRFRRMRCPNYQQVDGGLPVSTSGKKDGSEADGWDNSWGDDWDDEEAAPMTPSKPALTPSSKGLASRKFIKDTWKD